MEVNVSDTTVSDTFGNDMDDFAGNQTMDQKCGSMSEEILNEMMTCSFWMEGVLLIITGT